MAARPPAAAAAARSTCAAAAVPELDPPRFCGDCGKRLVGAGDPGRVAGPLQPMRVGASGAPLRPSRAGPRRPGGPAESRSSLRLASRAASTSGPSNGASASTARRRTVRLVGGGRRIAGRPASSPMAPSAATAASRTRRVGVARASSARGRRPRARAGCARRTPTRPPRRPWPPGRRGGEERGARRHPVGRRSTSQARRRTPVSGSARAAASSSGVSDPETVEGTEARWRAPRRTRRRARLGRWSRRPRGRRGRRPVGGRRLRRSSEGPVEQLAADEHGDADQRLRGAEQEVVDDQQPRRPDPAPRRQLALDLALDPGLDPEVDLVARSGHLAGRTRGAGTPARTDRARRAEPGGGGGSRRGELPLVPDRRAAMAAITTTTMTTTGTELTREPSVPVDLPGSAGGSAPALRSGSGCESHWWPSSIPRPGASRRWRSRCPTRPSNPARPGPWRSSSPSTARRRRTCRGHPWPSPP